MSKRPDDFPPNVIKILGARVNYECSRPDCGAPTSGPHSDPKKSSNVGVAAHITAASPRGARYDATLTSDQRKHPDNGIWLCGTHAKEIDNDEVTFPVELVKEWKRKVESKASANIGRPQQQEIPHLAQLIETNAIQAATINRLTLEVPTASIAQSAPDERWKGDIERALNWSESNEGGKVGAAKAIINEIRESDNFEVLSSETRARLATISAVCAVEIGDFATAEIEADEALRLQPNNVIHVSNAAGAAVVCGNHKRAVELAQQALDKEPRNENAALALVQSWHFLSYSDQIQNFLSNNLWLLNSANGCAVVGQMHTHQDNYGEAIRLAKQSLKIDRNHIHALEVLFDALFFPLQNGVRNSNEWDFSTRTKRQLKRAEAAISRAITVLEKGLNKDRLHNALVNRAGVRSAQEKSDGAFADCDRVLHNDPSFDNRELATLNKALFLIHVGRGVEATPLLESLQSEQRREEGAFALGYSYHIAGHPDKALKVWESVWNPQKCDTQQMMIAGMLLWVYRQEGQDEAAENVLKRVRKECPESPEVDALIAQDKYETGDQDGAIALLKAATRVCEERGDEAGRVQMLLRTGDICYRVARVKEAVEAWRQIGWDRLLPPYRLSFMNALYRDGQLDEALTLAKKIRSESGFVPRAVETEAAINAYMGDYEEACRLWDELSRFEPQNPLHTVNRAQAALQGEDIKQVATALQKVSYESVKNDASTLRRISQMQVRLGFKEAIKFAFRARQIDFGNPESHRNYVTVFLDSTNYYGRDEDEIESNTHPADVLGLNGPNWGEIPCTIRLLPVGIDDQRQRRSFTILNEEPFDQARGIYPPSHDLAQRLLALQPNDTIPLRQSPADPDQQYRVIEVLSPYVHAFQESGTESASWFGEDAGVWSIDVRDNFDALFAFRDASGRGFQEVMKMYANWQLPLCSIGVLRSTSLFDLWFLVGSQPQWGIHAERGAVEVFNQLVENLQSESGKPTLVLDSTSLIALVHLNLSKIIAPHFRLLVPQSLRREVNKLKSEFLSPHIPNDLPQKLLDFIESETEVLPARAVIRFQPDDVQQWQRALGQTELDAALLAYEHDALLYADDALLREVAKFHPGVKSLNSQCILESLYRRELLTKESYYEVLENLALSNYRHLLLSADYIVWLLTKHDNVTNSSVRASFRLLNGPKCNHSSALRIIAYLLSELWKNSPKHKHRLNVLDLALMSLCNGRAINASLDALQLVLLHPHFELRQRQESLQEITVFIEQWRLRVNPRRPLAK